LNSLDLFVGIASHWIGVREKKNEYEEKKKKKVETEEKVE
jgi:hypothetical protein